MLGGLNFHDCISSVNFLNRLLFSNINSNNSLEVNSNPTLRTQILNLCHLYLIFLSILTHIQKQQNLPCKFSHFRDPDFQPISVLEFQSHSFAENRENRKLALIETKVNFQAVLDFHRVAFLAQDRLQFVIKNFNTDFIPLPSNVGFLFENHFRFNKRIQT